MALAKQITQFQIYANSTSHTINHQNMDFRWELERFTDESTALDGTILNENVIAGRRLYVDINYNQNIEPYIWNSMSDDIVSDFIYNNVGKVDFYPDATTTSPNTVLTISNGSIDIATDIITTSTPFTHGLASGQRLRVSATNITGLTVSNFYYTNVVDVSEFSLSNIISGSNINLSGTTTSRTLTLQEDNYIEMAVENLDELQSYKDTISSFKPSIRLKSKYRYVRIPSLFANV